MYNPYMVLGVSSLSSKDEIKTKYKQLCKKFHPDNPNTGDSDKFQAVQKAWEYIETYHKDIKSSRGMWRHKTLFTIYKED